MRPQRIPWASPARNTIVVAGGGFTGIETAAEMPARLREALGEDADVNVIAVDRHDEVAAELGAGPRPVITQALEELGVTWRLGVTVASVDENGLTTANGERIDAKTVIWTAGVRASALTQQIPAERDAFGRLHVDGHLRVKGVDTVFATGDVAYAATDDEGNHAAMSCQHAMNLGRSAGHNVAADLLGLAPTLGRRIAVAATVRGALGEPLHHARLNAWRMRRGREMGSPGPGCLRTQAIVSTTPPSTRSAAPVVAEACAEQT
ncbi:hypothetical protein CS8_076220 [Cupriavidus sp. 8B]